MADTQILVVKPKTLTAADKKLLREAGVVCIEAADPTTVRLLSTEGPPMGCNDMFYAAIQAIAGDRYSDNTSKAFTSHMAAMCKASRGVSA